MMHRYGLILIALLIQACSQNIALAPEAEHARELINWKLDGKIALKTATEGHSASISWNQQGQHFDIDLYGPMGAGRIELTGDEHGATLRDSTGEYTAASASELLHQLSGMSMPVEMLHWWVRGLPSPKYNTSNARYNEDGRLSGFDQEGWTLQIERFTRTGKLTLPSYLKAKKNDLQVKLVIKSWGAGDKPAPGSK